MICERHAISLVARLHGLQWRNHPTWTHFGSSWWDWEVQRHETCTAVTHAVGEHSTIWPEEQDTPWWCQMQWPMVDDNVRRRNDKNLTKGVWTSKFSRFEVADKKDEKRNRSCSFVYSATILKSFQEAYLWAPCFPFGKRQCASTCPMSFH